MNDCCYVCSDSRESMDPFDKYPDMGSYRTVMDEHWTYCDCHPECDNVDSVELRPLRVWVCDVCTEDNEKESA
jgi:hypothetical protein